MNILQRLCLPVLVVLALPACHAQPAQPAAELTLRQRSASALPGWDPALTVGIDDVTGGAVLSWVDLQGRHIAGPQRLAQGGSLRFRFQGHDYDALLTRLDNALIGEDFATFSVQPADAAATTPAARAAANVDQQIEQQLAHLAAQTGAQLIRNGSAHPVADGVAHLRRKWQQQRAKVKSLDDFIRLCATRSEQTGQPYLIRLEDGRELELATWLRAAL